MVVAHHVWVASLICHLYVVQANVQESGQCQRCAGMNAVNVLVNRLEHTSDRQVILELDSDRLVRQRLED